MASKTSKPAQQQQQQQQQQDADDTEYRPVPIQQGVQVKVADAAEMRRAWKNFKRDDYDSDMDSVCGKVGSVLHQHPSGAFTVVFEGKAGGQKGGNKARFKFPPSALLSCDRVPVKKRKPKLPKHIKVTPKGKKDAVPRTSVSLPPPPPASQVTPTTKLVEPEVVYEPPPDCSRDQQQIDVCLQPSPKCDHPDDEKKRLEDARVLAIREEEEEFEGVEVLPISPPPIVKETSPDVEDDDDEAEAAFLEALEAEDEEEAAFLAELEDGASTATPSPPPSSQDSPQKPQPLQPPTTRALAPTRTADLSSPISPNRLRHVTSTKLEVADVDNGPRVQIVYEPHASVLENTMRFDESYKSRNHGSPLVTTAVEVDEEEEVEEPSFLRVNELRARYDMA